MSDTNIVCYEHNQGFVLERFRQGEFDYLDTASEVFETEFFRYIGAEKILQDLARTYPSPRKKEEIPVWFYLASNLSMRLHGVHSFHAFPYVVRCGGMLNAFGPEVAHKAKHPDTGDVTLSCQGFNDKNAYDRQTPCDQDYLRKFSRDTKAKRLMSWYNQKVAQVLQQHGAFDAEGLFSGDASYIFVPDNPDYEGSVRMLFDEHDHPVEADYLKTLTPQQAARYQWRRCYKMVSLLHTNRERTFFSRVAIRMVPGNQHESPVFYELLEEFVNAVGRGVIKRLLLDRGFLDGVQVGKCKLDYGIEVLMPLKKNMAIYQDALGLLKLPDVRWTEVTPEPSAAKPPRPSRAPELLRRREAKRQRTLKARQADAPPPAAEKTVVRREVAGLQKLTSWDSCPIPLNMIVNRDTYGDGHQELWMLLDTQTWTTPEAPEQGRQDYRLRVAIEEGHRQFKCFWDLAAFTSRAFSLVVNQILFVALAYNLLQLYLKDQGRPELNPRTRPSVQRQLLPNDSWIIIYCQNRFALVNSYEYTELLLTLSQEAHTKILDKARRLKRQIANELAYPRPP